MKKLFISLICLTSFAANSMSSFDAQVHRLTDENDFLKTSICYILESSPLATCKTPAVARLKEHYSTALPAVKKTTAKAAFKNYYISTLSQVNALEVNGGETVRTYDQRQRDAKARTDDMWLLFEVEMNF